MFNFLCDVMSFLDDHNLFCARTDRPMLFQLILLFLLLLLLFLWLLLLLTFSLLLFLLLLIIDFMIIKCVYFS